MFERFTEDGRHVVVLAQEEARDLSHRYIGTEHILLGLLRLPDQIPGRALETFNVDAATVRATVIETIGRGDEPTGAQVPFTPEAKKTLELSLRAALKLRHDWIESGHILLGLIDVGSGAGVDILGRLDVPSQALRERVVMEVASSGRRYGISVERSEEAPEVDGPSEASARNIALAHRYYAECPPDDGDPDRKRAQLVVDEILSPDFTMYFNCETDADAGHGRQEHKQFLVAHTRAFADERWTVEAIVADAQTVACQWRCQATHRETSNPIDMHAADFFTVRDGRLAELRRFLDFNTLGAQIEPPPTDM
jgi:ketosteroid isomerase-like protein